MNQIDVPITNSSFCQDMMSVLKRTSKFFGKTYTDSQLTKLAEHLSFDTMKSKTTGLILENIRFSINVFVSSANPTANHTTLLKTLGEIRNKKIEFQ